MKLTKKVIQHKIERAQKSIAELEQCKNDLSIHGHWSLGYWKGRLSVLEELLDDIEEAYDNNNIIIM